MDGQGLISFLESIRQDVPGPLQGAFEDLVQLVRNIVDALEQVIAPQEVIDTGKQLLNTHHTTLLSHASTLKTNLDDFQTVYTGDGSDAYYQTAYQAHLQLGHLTDHLSFAMGAHDTISTNLGNGQFAHDGLGFMLGAMIVSSPSLPEGTPLVAGEGAGAGFSMAALWAAMDAINAALGGLLGASLPWIAGALGTLIIVKALTDSGVLNFARKTFVLNNPVPTPQQQQAINDLAAELGLTSAAQKAWLQYLMSLLGVTKLTLDQIKDIIRCLNARGWLQDLNPTSWNDDYITVWNIVSKNLQPDDIQAAWMDLRDIPVIDKTGKIWPSHLQKVSDALNGLKKILASKEQPPLSKSFKDAISKLINWVNEKVFGPDDPKTWTDQGRSPFWEDTIKNSGCLKNVTGSNSLP